MPRREIALLGITLAVVVWFVWYGFHEGFRAITPSWVENLIFENEPIAPEFPPVPVVPGEVRALYVTARVASAPAHIESLIGLIKATELNALVVNVKDGDGIYVGEGMAQLVRRLREEGVYPIARVVTFQDNALARARPDLALKNADGSLWVGGGWYLWVDPASKEVWDRVADVARRALANGFAEVNFDYIRFPSDGDVNSIVFPIYDGKRPANAVMRDCYEYLSGRIREGNPEAVLSIDLFAFSFLQDDGLGVGQRVGDAARFFDVVSPMIYPSHYTPGNLGFPNPAEEPYEVVKQTLERGKPFLAAASSTAIVRPWLQDFDIGAVYDARMVREEIRAVADAGFGNTWMIWNPANVYDAEKFLPEK